MKAKRQIESSLNSVTMLDGTGGHVQKKHPREHRRQDQSLLREVYPGVSRPAGRVDPENPRHKSGTLKKRHLSAEYKDFSEVAREGFG